MELNELNTLVYCMTHYRDEEFNNRFGLLEYYSMTDINPRDLSKIARQMKKASTSAHLLDFDNRNFFGSVKLKEHNVVNCAYAINDRVFTVEEKLSVVEKMKEEGYPIIDGIYYASLRRYAVYGLDGITKENVRAKVMKFYNESMGINNDNQCVTEQKNKVLIK